MISFILLWKNELILSTSCKNSFNQFYIACLDSNANKSSLSLYSIFSKFFCVNFGKISEMTSLASSNYVISSFWFKLNWRFWFVTVDSLSVDYLGRYDSFSRAFPSAKSFIINFLVLASAIFLSKISFQIRLYKT